VRNANFAQNLDAKLFNMTVPDGVSYKNINSDTVVRLTVINILSFCFGDESKYPYIISYDSFISEMVHI